MLETDIQALQVLSNEDNVNVLVAPAGKNRTHRTKIRIQAERFAQPDVHRTKSSTDRRRQGALQRKPRAADALQQGVGQWIAGFLDRGHAALMRFPYKGRTEPIEDLHDGRANFRPDAITRNQGCRYQFLFIGLHTSLQETYKTASLAKSKSNVRSRVTADRRPR